MLRELTLRGVSAKIRAWFPVCYKGQYGGESCADLVANERVIVEWKCVDRLGNEHSAQCINYLLACPTSAACRRVADVGFLRDGWFRMLAHHY
jgi:GxxExxY protein